MNEFIKIYNQIKQNPYHRNQLINQYINAGMGIYSSTTDPNLKEQVLTKLIEIIPEEPGFYYYMGYTFKDINPQKALPFYKKSYEINPTNIENMIDLCNLLNESENHQEVIELNKKIPFNKEQLSDIRFLTLYVQAKCKTQYYKDALNQLLYVIQIKEKQPAITEKDKEWMFSNYLNLGHIYSILGEYDKSIHFSEKAIQYTKKENLEEKYRLTAYQNLLCFYDYSYSNDIKIKNNLYNELNKLIPNSTPFRHHNKQIINRKLRIGYVSSDFMNHAVANFIYPILKNHNHSKVDIILFPNQTTIFPQFIELNIPYFNILDLSDFEAAKLIYSKEIDILIDLNGHTAKNRLGVFSYNPCPIQVTYLGYPNTTGLNFFKYRITDSIADNQDTKQFYTEELIRLPKCFLLYQSINQIKPIVPRKTKDIIILGSLNKENKNSPHVLKTWKKILYEYKNTKLLIKLEAYDDQETRLEFYKKHLDVDKSRLLLITKTNNEGYNRLFSMIDILLDTFPYSGTTTTCNALYNSIPVVTYNKPDIHAHNVSSSLLINSGFPELVANSEEEYINIVKGLINQPERIDKYKEEIHNKFINLMNPERFMVSYEKLLQEIYEKEATNEKEKEEKEATKEKEEKMTKIEIMF
jgi:predicted O-linked N-acetylglucosamine transferase (SPINDLY family)